jgi:hypothetical protein
MPSMTFLFLQKTHWGSSVAAASSSSGNKRDETDEVILKASVE